MYKIIEVPSSLGAPDIHCGMELGPEVLSEMLREKSDKVCDTAIKIEAPHPKPEHATGDFINKKNLPEIIELNQAIQMQTIKCQDAGNIPLVLMGDDSSTIGCVYGVLTKKPNLGIIWFDTHADMNTPETSLSGCFYGMGLAHIIGMGDPDLLAINKAGKFVSRNNVGLIGQRNLDTAEKEFIERNNIMVFPGNFLKLDYERNLETLVEALKVNGVSHIFFHFDLDVIDAAEDPPVYAPHRNGLLKSEISNISLLLRNQFDLAGISIANYIPGKDVQNAKGWILETIEKLYQ